MPRKKLQPLSRVTEKLLAQTDKIIATTDLDTCAVGVQKGRATLYLGKLFREADTETQEAMLKHEAFHFLMGHQQRGEAITDCDKELFNRCCDAAIHGEYSNVNWQKIEAGTGIKVVRFETLGIDEMPPEQAYELLKQKGPEPQQGHGQGSGESGSPNGHGQPGSCGNISRELSDDEPESQAKRTVIQAEITQGHQADCAESGEFDGFTGNCDSPISTGGMSKGPGRSKPTVVKQPAWVVEVLDRLLNSSQARTERTRSYSREHRYLGEMFPGKARRKGWQGVWIIDASGSIDKDSVNQMLSAAIGTPELESSEVVVFDTKFYGPFDIFDTQEIEDAISKCGGGTYIKGCADWLDSIGYDIEPRVWLTDGHSADGLPEQRDEDTWVRMNYRAIQVLDYIQY